MAIRIFDSHTHAHFPAYDADRDAVIRRALDNGIGMVNVGTDKKMSEAAIRLAETYPEGVYATVGLHPIHTGPAFHDEDEGETEAEEEFDYGFYLSLAKHPKVVAIGECGFDYFRLPEGKEEEEREKQKTALLAQTRLAKEAGKPLMFHCRSSADGGMNAYRDLADFLRDYESDLPGPRGIAHFFSGSVKEAKELLSLGLYFTFGGAVTLPKRPQGADFEALAKMMPEDRILAETDAPYVAPLAYRGKRNEPAYVVEAIKKLAEFRGVPVSEMEHITFENAKRVFNLTNL